MTDPMFDYSLSQATKAVDLVRHDDDILEAVSNTVSWADIALKQLVAAGVPALHASGLIVASVNTALNSFILQPPEQED